MQTDCVSLGIIKYLSHTALPIGYNSTLLIKDKWPRLPSRWHITNMLSTKSLTSLHPQLDDVKGSIWCGKINLESEVIYIWPVQPNRLLNLSALSGPLDLISYLGGRWFGRLRPVVFVQSSAFVSGPTGNPCHYNLATFAEPFLKTTNSQQSTRIPLSKIETVKLGSSS